MAVGIHDEPGIDTRKRRSTAQALVDRAHTPVVGGERRRDLLVAVREFLHVGNADSHIHHRVKERLGSVPRDAELARDLFTGCY